MTHKSVLRRYFVIVFRGIIKILDIFWYIQRNNRSIDTNP